MLEPLDDLFLDFSLQGWVNRTVGAPERSGARDQLDVMLNERGPAVFPVQGEDLVVAYQHCKNVGPLRWISQQLGLVQREQLLDVLTPLLIAAWATALETTTDSLGSNGLGIKYSGPKVSASP